MNRQEHGKATSMPLRKKSFLHQLLAVLFVHFAVLTAGLAVTSPAIGQVAGAEMAQVEVPELGAEIERITDALSSGTVGVGVIHLESGREFYWNGNERFPMASTYKVPIAVRLLERVDEGELNLDSLIVLQPSDRHPGSGQISRLLELPGAHLSIRNILELTLRISDNSATDIALDLAGGPYAVNQTMRQLGIDSLQVDRPTLRLIADWIGMYDVPPSEEFDLDEFTAQIGELSSEDRELASEAFDADPRDTATPVAMAKLLAKIWHGETLSQEQTDLLLDIMERCETGDNRLRGMLPGDVEVMHKTGTIGGTLNDVGIIRLPDDAGHVVTAVFIKESEADNEEREATIAHVARAVYDYFLYE